MNITIEAGPGTGKSTTLEYAYHYLLTQQYQVQPTQEQVNICGNIHHYFKGISPSQIVFVAFNVTTRDRLQERLPQNTKAYTFNGLGTSLVQKRHKYQALNKLRGQKLLCHIIGQNLNDLPYPKRLEMYGLLKYISYCKEELLLPSPDSFHQIYTKYNIGPPPENVELATKLMQLMAIPNGELEYIDQVWMGLQTLQQPVYELAFVDEAQDLSVLRLEFSLRVAKNVVFCGDGFQSINAFAGADHKAFEKLRAVSAFTLPLKTSFRLPPNHIEYANTVRPARITPWKTTPGPIEAISLADLPQTIIDNIQGRKFTVKWKPPKDHPIYNTPSNPPTTPPSPQLTNSTPTTSTQPLLYYQSCIYDPTTHLWTIPPPERYEDPKNHLIIGRTNAEIFRVAIMLLKKNIAGQIIRRKEDQDIQQTLLYYLKDKKANSLSQLHTALDRDIIRAKSEGNKKGALLYEKAACIKFLANEAKCLNDIPALLEQLTADKPNPIRLCTIHKSKGMECPFIYILFPPVRHSMAETPAEKEQEINLEFVSETRSMFYKGYVKE